MKLTSFTVLKSNKLNPLILVLVLFSVQAFAQTKTETDSIPEYWLASKKEIWNKIDSFFDDPAFNSSNWGVLIQSLRTGEVLYKRNETKLFIPASNQKLLTTSAALEILGPSYQFRTIVATDGEIDGSILNGNLMIKGYGDPSISGRFHNGNIFSVFQTWVERLQEIGIDEIRGNIIGYDDAFDEINLGEAWHWDYETYWYAAPIGALSFNDNCVDITIKPSKVLSQAVVTSEPESKMITIINQVVTVPSDSVTNIQFQRLRSSNIIRITGTIKENQPDYKIYVSINNPTQFFVVTLKKYLEDNGIKVTGFAIDYDDISNRVDIQNFRDLFDHYSKPLTEIIRVINKNSQNFFAEQLLKTIGYELFGLGSAEHGKYGISEFLAKMDITQSQYRISDGSGLSRLNLITPEILMKILVYMNKSSLFSYFYNSLPVAGVDGTISSRMKNSPAEYNVRAKTGFVGFTRSLSGYMNTYEKEPIAFVMIVNNLLGPISVADNVQDKICIQLSKLKRK
ncbi:MAG: D-alanyl-D-alanine carboxypeptidase/D-alanyl-D-alanine-endopeptidase [Ignavibacteriaceae bacterium]|nr:D-alanyl-D-alanine carboxypeptidase/D-alanyl-D-alanine-endopeptidase [Ignavibacteriaceae bacterium]